MTHPAIQRFTASDSDQRRLQTFIKRLWEALVPSSGPSATLQGELVRVSGRVADEYFRNGLMNYYHSERPPGDDGAYATELAMALTTLVKRREGLDPDDVASLEHALAHIEPDWRANVRTFELELKDEEGELTEAEQREFEALDEVPPLIPWEEMLVRLERSVANWCVAHPALEDLTGQPTKVVLERRTLDDPAWPCSHLEHLFTGPPPPEKCPQCGGRGFIQPDDPKKFPSRCTHPGHTAT